MSRAPGGGGIFTVKIPTFSGKTAENVMGVYGIDCPAIFWDRECTTFWGGGRGCAGALTRPSTRHLPPKNFEKTALRKRGGIFTVKMRGGHNYGNCCTPKQGQSTGKQQHQTPAQVVAGAGARHYWRWGRLGPPPLILLLHLERRWGNSTSSASLLVRGSVLPRSLYIIITVAIDQVLTMVTGQVE